MIAKEVQYRLELYVALIIVLSGMIAAILLANTQSLKMLLSLGMGVVYFLWGAWSHRKEIMSIRLMLEYLGVAAIGSGMLVLLTRTL